MCYTPRGVVYNIIIITYIRTFHMHCIGNMQVYIILIGAQIYKDKK